MDITGLVKGFLQAENARDWASWQTYLHPEVEYRVIGKEQTIRGADEYTRHMQTVYAELPDWRFETISLCGTGNTVTVEFDGRGHFSGFHRGREHKNVPLRLQAVCVFEITDNLIYQVREYFDCPGYERQLQAGGSKEEILDNQILATLRNHKSIRKYRRDMPAPQVVETVVKVGQQAPFASQLYSIILDREGKHPFGAPLLFTICVDVHKLTKVMERRGWQVVTNDLSLLFFGIQDAALAAENIVVAGESLGLGSCFLGGAPYFAQKIVEKYKLPQRVFPLVQLVMGYPAENPPARPRYPLDFILFEGEYPRLDDDRLAEAMAVMDSGYLAQDYYERGGVMINLEGGKDEEYTFADYSWTEHISRKWGQWFPSPEKLLEQLEKCGFIVR